MTEVKPATDEELLIYREWDAHPLTYPRLAVRTVTAALFARIEVDRAEIATLQSQVRRCHAIMQGLVSLMDSDEDAFADAHKELSGEFCAGACTTACDVARDEDRAEIARLKAHLDETLYERDRLKAEAERMSRPCESCEGRGWWKESGGTRVDCYCTGRTE